MKNKKCISETTVVVLIIGLLSLAVLVGTGYTITKGISSAGNKAAVQNWVLLKSSKLGLVQGGSQPPVAMLYSDSIKINTEAQLKTEGNKLIADAMVDCWSAFDKGKSNFIDGKGVNDPFCFPCAKIEFDKSLKDGSHNLLEFNNFLSNEKPLSVVKAQSYHEILEGKYVYEQTIQKDKDMYIFFIATKGKIWDRLMKRLMAPDIFSEISKRAAAGAFIGGAAGSVLPGPGTAAGVVIGVGAGVLEYYVSPITGTGEEYFEPMVLLGTPEKISEYCNLELDKCENCGDGNLEKCDKDECQDLADVTGTSCYWDTKYINECLSTQKPDAEELKSANPIQTTTSTTTPATDIKITSEQCKVSTGSSEMKALLDTIAWAEGADYNIMFGKRVFTDFSAHPVYTGQMPSNGFPYGKTTSTASGRYQFLKGTYDSEKKIGFFSTGFTPEEQDKAAIDLITRKRSLTEEQLKKSVESGNLRLVWDKLMLEWASIPTSSGKSYYGQSAKTEEQLKLKYYQCYQQYNKALEPLLTAQK